MLNKDDFHVYVKGILLSIWTLLFIKGLTQYTGSALIYSVFSTVFLGMLISGFYRKISYGYLFLVTMLWLGFWLKTTAHLIVDYPFGEPIGGFSGTHAEWNEVLTVATIAALGVIASRLIFWSTGATTSMVDESDSFKAPAWYLPIRKWVWFGLIFSSISVATINLTFGIELSGLTPKIVLMWPLNAVTYWLLASGFSLFIATLLWWDISLRQNVSSVVYFMIVEAFVSSVSILSRGTYIFHIIPQMYGIYKNRVRVLEWTATKWIKFCAVFVLVFMVSLSLVNTLRSYYFSNQAPVWSGEIDIRQGANTFARFAVDRWLGTEGVMAVAAYPNKGKELLRQGLIEKSEIGTSSMYQKICLSHYPEMDLNKFRFASLPGAVAFLYYTGSLWVVFLGIIILSLLVFTSEYILFRLTRNPLLTALWGGFVANTVVQMGVAPRGLLTYFFEMICGIALIYLLQSQLFSGLVDRIVRLRKA